MSRSRDAAPMMSRFLLIFARRAEATFLESGGYRERSVGRARRVVIRTSFKFFVDARLTLK